MTVKERFLTALENRKPDRLPVTTHHIMDSYLNDYEGGKGPMEFFRKYKMDPVVWISVAAPQEKKGQWIDPSSGYAGIQTEQWKVRCTKTVQDSLETGEYTIETPGGSLSVCLQSNAHTSWLIGPVIRDKSDIDILGSYMPDIFLDHGAVYEEVQRWGDSVLIRGTVPPFDIMGQPGCWQDAAVLVGIERLIMETYDDPAWVHELLKILQRRKVAYMNSATGAPIDIYELGGGDASTTVISPAIFNAYVAPYDKSIIEAAHANRQRIVYHTCGGMMPILEDIAAMGPHAMETFTPRAMGGDVDLREAHRRIGDKVCIIGGFDQHYYFTEASEEETRAEVRRCFDSAGKDGGYILSPSDHFFDARPELLHAFADEARACVYE